MKQANIVRWGIVGAGRIAHTFAKDLALVANASLTAVAARQAADALAFAKQHQIALALEGYQSLFEHPDVDAVYIATPHSHHFEQVRQALLAGKHVLCEKPFTVSVSQCQTLMTLAQQQGCFLMEAMWTWFLPAIQQALTWVQHGRIGRLLHIKADFGYPLAYDPARREYDARLAGGCLLEMGIYPLALNALFRPEPAPITDIRLHQAANGVEDDLSWTLAYPQGNSQLSTSFRCRLPNAAFIVGDEGYIAIPDFFRARQASLYHLDEQVANFIDTRHGSGFEFEIQAACDDILAGQTQNAIMPWSQSLMFQAEMTRILAQLPQIPSKTPG